MLPPLQFFLIEPFLPLAQAKLKSSQEQLWLCSMGLQCTAFPILRDDFSSGSLRLLTSIMCASFIILLGKVLK